MGEVLANKNILVGVTGSIAAYKSAMLVSILRKMGADVEVIMTDNATKFIAPLTFSTYTGHRTITDMFDESFEYTTEHISLAQKADIVIVAPASANFIAKLAHGIADDMLTTTLLATKAPILISPAMNTNMYENPATKDNLSLLKSRGIEIIDPDSGLLACGVTGPGKMPEPEVLADHIMFHALRDKCLKGKRVLVSAGPTRETIDPVRFISNHSTGKMGFALAKEAAYMGAKVDLVCGPVSLKTPLGVNRIDVISADQMKQEILNNAEDADIIIMAAAVADYCPKNPAKEKIKKKDTKGTEIELIRTVDILTELSKKNKANQFLCGFSMETENMLENSREKLTKKGVDMIVANNLKQKGAGFATDTNIVTLITKDGDKQLPLLSKEDSSYLILKEIAEKLNLC